MSGNRWSLILAALIVIGPNLGGISAQQVGPPPPPILCIDEDVPLENAGFGNLLTRITSFNNFSGADSINAFQLSIAHDPELFLIDINIDGTLLKAIPPMLFLVNLNPPGAGGPRFHDSGPVMMPISNVLPPVVSEIPVLEPGSIADLNVGVDAMHTFSADLVIDLASPSGTIVTLHNQTGGAADYMLTIYDEPGGVLPDGPGNLADYNGEDKFGDWILTISDLAGGDDGTLNSWFLDIFNAGPMGGTLIVEFDNTGPPFDGIPVGGVQEPIANWVYADKVPGSPPGTMLPVVFDDSLDPLVPNTVTIDGFDFTAGNGLELNNGGFVQDTSEFIRGECNDDGSLDIADGIFLLAFLFGSGTAPSCAAACDADGDGVLGVGDAIYIITFLLLDGPPPGAPFPACGPPNFGEVCDSFMSCP